MKEQNMEVTKQEFTPTQIASFEMQSSECLLHALLHKAEEVFKPLNFLSERIRTLEDRLNELNVHVPFKILVDRTEEKTGKTDWYLSWDSYCEHELIHLDRYRLFLRGDFEGTNYKGHFDRYCSFQKPFIETGMWRRLKYLNKFDDFVLDFCVFLEFKKHDLVAIISKDDHTKDELI